MAKKACESGYYEWTCSIAQQAAEKSVNAVYRHMGHLPWGMASDPFSVVLREKFILLVKSSNPQGCWTGITFPHDTRTV